MTEEKKDITETFLEVLNRALETDRNAIQWLFTYRVECNQELAEDPTIQVRSRDDTKCSLAVIGLLNGILSALDGNAVNIAMEVEVDFDSTEYIRRFLKFKE